MLEQLTCEQNLGGLHRLLHVSPRQQPLLAAYRALACNGSRATRQERFAQLASKLQEQLDTPKIVSRVRAGQIGQPGGRDETWAGFSTQLALCWDGEQLHGLASPGRPLL